MTSFPKADTMRAAFYSKWPVMQPGIDLKQSYESPKAAQELAPSVQKYIDAAVAGAERISSTFRGISDTTCSAEKPKLQEGPQLGSHAMENFRRALAGYLQAGDLNLRTIEDVKDLIENVARRLNEGLGGDQKKLWRSWSLHGNYGLVPPERLAEEMAKFCARFLELYNDKTIPAARAAAETEYVFNGMLHPLADGCGRGSVLLAALLLSREGKTYPLFSSRDDYYGGFSLSGRYDEESAFSSNNSSGNWCPVRFSQGFRKRGV